MATMARRLGKTWTNSSPSNMFCRPLKRKREKAKAASAVNAVETTVVTPDTLIEFQSQSMKGLKGSLKKLR